MSENPELPPVERTNHRPDAGPEGEGADWKSRLVRLATLRSKLIIPYVLLSLLLALVGIYVVSRLVASSWHERVSNQLAEVNTVAADGIVRQERENLENLRLMVFSQGVPEAMVARDIAALETLLFPIMGNNKVDFVAAVDPAGVEISTWDLEANGETYIRTEGYDFSGNPLVANIIDGAVDATGDKYVGFLEPVLGRVLATSAPVYNEAGTLTGVLMVGIQVERMLAELESQALADLILLDMDSQLISTTLTQPAEIETVLELAGAQARANSSAAPVDIVLYERQYQIMYTDLRLRGQTVGSLGVVLPSSYAISAEAQSRWVFILVFTIGTAGTILVGYALAQNIARPILHLRSLSQSVASGDLNQESGLERTDEIGELADAFDQMTENLRQRTAEAERLYAETVQRNIELASINKRLQDTQRQLVQSEKLAAVGLLTAGIVHDVKNPLTVIKGTAELLQEEKDHPPEMQKALSLIREGAVKANKIVSDLLTFARQAPPELKSQDLRETVQAAIRLTTYLTRQAKVRMAAELPEQPVLTVYDAQQIEQVFINLITNGMQAIPDRGDLYIKLIQDDQFAAVSFRDTGSGISPENLHRIFDPFFTTKPEGQGTGLGLSVSYGIIASHGGRIEVSSEVGQGSTFTVYLPVDQNSPPGEVLKHGD
jgi:signal transduction histidine kinase